MAAEIITLEEVQRAKHTMWLETHNWRKDIFEEVSSIKIDSFSDYVLTGFTNKNNWEITCTNHLYGIDWRCWTEQPSETQREAIKWK